MRPLPFASTIDESGLHCVDHRSGGCAPSKIAVTNNKKNNRMQIPSNSAFECTNALLVLLMEKKEGQKKNSEARIASPHLAPLLLPSLRGYIGAPAAGVPISSAILFFFSPGVLALRGVRRLSPSILRRKKTEKAWQASSSWPRRASIPVFLFFSSHPHCHAMGQQNGQCGWPR